MTEKHDEVIHDIGAMSDAVAALSTIPTYMRRKVAFQWLMERVYADLAELQNEEHIERMAELAARVDSALGAIR